MHSYEFLREKVLRKDENGSFPLWKGIVAGFSSGVIGQAIASPTDLVKVQMQADGKREEHEQAGDEDANDPPLEARRVRETHHRRLGVLRRARRRLVFTLAHIHPDLGKPRA